MRCLDCRIRVPSIYNSQCHGAQRIQWPYRFGLMFYKLGQIISVENERHAQTDLSVILLKQDVAESTLGTLSWNSITDGKTKDC